MKRKPKLAFMIPGLGRIRRGVEANVSTLALKLAKDYKVTIFSLTKANPLCKTSWAVSQNNKLLTRIYQAVPFLNKFLGKYFSYWPVEIECLTFSFSLFPKLLKKDFDVFFPVSIWGVMMARVLRLIKGTKFIHINHGGAENFIAKQKPDAFVVLTSDVFSWARKNHPQLKSVLIPFGIDSSRFSPETKAVKLNLEKPIFLSVSALVPYKRIDLTIRAVAKLKKGGLVVLGKGELKEKLEKLGDQLLGQKRFLLTSVPYDQIPGYYTAADVFTLASKEDTFPVVYLEALASNQPVVAPKEERRKFTIGEAGLLSDVENLSEYSRALEKAAKTDFGNKPRQQAEKFSLDKMVREYKKLIAELISQ